MLLRIGIRKTGGTFEPEDDRVKNAVAIIGQAQEARPRLRLGRNPGGQFRRQPRLADAGLARQQHHLALAARGLRPSPHQQVQLLFAPDEVDEARRA